LSLIALLRNGCWVFSFNAEFIIIDFNGEYIDDAIIDTNGKNSYDLTTKAMKKNDKRKKLPITKSTIENAAFWSIFLEATEKTQQPFLKRAIKDKFIEEKLNDTDFIVHIQNLIIQSTSFLKILSRISYAFII
jgi:hypothetical protein